MLRTFVFVDECYLLRLRIISFVYVIPAGPSLRCDIIGDGSGCKCYVSSP